MRVWIVGLVAVACGVAAAKSHERESHDTFGMERVSPHVSWGVPLRGGPIHTLFIAPRYTLRDSVELAERLELDVETVPLWDSGHIGLDTAQSKPEYIHYTAEEGLRTLRDALSRDYDLIVLGNLDPSVFPDDVLASLIEKVKAGTGLLTANVDTTLAPAIHDFISSLPDAASGSEVTQGIGDAFTPEWGMGLRFVKTLSADKGRVAQLNYDGASPVTHFLLPAFSDSAHAETEFMDTYFSLVAKAARWAAGHTVECAISSVTLSDPSGPSESEIPPGFPEEYVEVMRSSGVKLPYHVYRVTLGGPAPRNLDIQWRIREPGFKTVFGRLIGAPVKKGAQSVDVQVFAGPGKHYLDLWLVDKKDVWDWYTEPISLDGWPNLMEMRYSKSVLLANDGLDIGATIKPTYNQPRGCTLYARAKDSFGRLVAEAYQPVSQDGGSAHVRLDFVDLITNYVSVEVFAVDSPQGPFGEFMLMRSAHDGRDFPVRTPYSHDSFSLVVQCSGCAEYNERSYGALLSDLGVDMAYCRGDRFTGLRLAQSRLRPLPLLSPSSESSAATSTLAEDRQAEYQRFQTAAKELWGAGSPLYVLGDWETLRQSADGMRISKVLQQAFASWLQREYGDLARLNAAWGGAFGSWDAAASTAPAPGVKPDHFAPSSDSERFLDVLAVSHVEDGRASLRAVDGEAMVGITASGDADWGGLSNGVDVLCAPSNDAIAEKLRSYRARGGLIGEWFDGAMSSAAATRGAWAPWHAVLHGLNSVWYADAIGTVDSPRVRGAVDPFGRPTESLAAVGGAAERIKSGVGTMLLRAARMNSGIAIYDSPASARLNRVDKTFACDTTQSEAAFVGVLRSLGYSYSFLSETMLKQGVLKDYTILILPMVRAMSIDEVNAIRKFCEEGGHIVADFLPGRYDTHGVAYPEAPLRDLFGVLTRSIGEPGEASTAEVSVHFADEETKATLRQIIPDASIAAGAATPGGAAGGVPVWLSCGAGQGQAVLLNYSLAGSQESSDVDSAGLVTLAGALLPALKATLSAEVSVSKRGAFRGESLQYRYGAARLAALLRDVDGGAAVETVRLTMNSKGSVYNVLSGGRIGSTKTIPVKLRRGEVALYAQLPYDVTGITMLAPETAPAGRRLSVRMKVRTQGDLPGEHVIHLELAPQNAPALRYYSRDVACFSGEGETYFPLARNEAAGFYRITAHDVLTGVETSTVVEVTTPGR